MCKGAKIESNLKSWPFLGGNIKSCFELEILLATYLIQDFG